MSWLILLFLLLSVVAIRLLPILRIAYFALRKCLWFSLNYTDRPFLHVSCVVGLILILTAFLLVSWQVLIKGLQALGYSVLLVSNFQGLSYPVVRRNSTGQDFIRNVNGIKRDTQTNNEEYDLTRNGCESKCSPGLRIYEREVGHNCEGLTKI